MSDQTNYSEEESRRDRFKRLQKTFRFFVPSRLMVTNAFRSPFRAETMQAWGDTFRLLFL